MWSPFRCFEPSQRRPTIASRHTFLRESSISMIRGLLVSGPQARPIRNASDIKAIGFTLAGYWCSPVSSPSRRRTLFLPIRSGTSSIWLSSSTGYVDHVEALMAVGFRFLVVRSGCAVCSCGWCWLHCSRRKEGERMLQRISKHMDCA